MKADIKKCEKKRVTTMIANQIWKSRVIYFQCDADLKRKSFVFYRFYCE